MKFGLDVPYKMAQSKWEFHENLRIEGSTRLIRAHEITFTRVQWNCMIQCIEPVTELQGTEINVVAGRFRLIQVRTIQIVGTPAHQKFKFLCQRQFYVMSRFCLIEASLYLNVKNSLVK